MDSKVAGANVLNNTVSVIETATNTVVATVEVGVQPLLLTITPDGAFVYVVNEREATARGEEVGFPGGHPANEFQYPHTSTADRSLVA